MQVRTLVLIIVGIAVACAAFWQYKFNESINPPVETSRALASSPTPPRAVALPKKSEEYTVAATIDTLRQQQLSVINKSRTSNGLPAVSLDDTASRAAQRHCEAMASGDFFGHTGLDGSRPFHRYNLNEGGEGHVAENICLLKSSEAIATDDKTKAELALKGHGMFMAEVPPDDGHRRNILEKRHNYVGIGVFVKGGSYTYCEEFLDKYIEISAPAAKTIPSGMDVALTGRVVNPQEFGLFAIVATFDASLNPPSNPQPSSYMDSGSEKAVSVPPWDFNKKGGRYDRNTGEFSISLRLQKKGYYYIVFYLKENPSTIPYDGERSNSSTRISTNDGFTGGAQVIRVV